MRPNVRREQGSAAVWAILLVAVLGFVTTLAVAYGTGVALRHRADAAADLAALAAAGQALAGSEQACQAAADIAVRNGARLTACRLSGMAGEVADVQVAVSGAGLAARFVAHSRARAGPAHPLGVEGSWVELMTGSRRRGEQDVEQRDGSWLVQRIVAVAALRRLHA